MCFFCAVVAWLVIPILHQERLSLGTRNSRSGLFVYLVSRKLACVDRFRSDTEFADAD